MEYSALNGELVMPKHSSSSSTLPRKVKRKKCKMFSAVVNGNANKCFPAHFYPLPPHTGSYMFPQDYLASLKGLDRRPVQAVVRVPR
jgi:hypothetical protein